MRLAFVLPVPPSAAGPAERAAAWPDDQLLLRLLHDRHGIDAHAVWPATRGPAASVTIDGVTHHSTPALVRTVRRLRPDVVHVNGLVFPRLTVALRLALGVRPRLVAQHHGELVPTSRRGVLAGRTARYGVDAYLFCGLPGQAEPWRAAGILGSRTARYEVLEASTDLRADPAEAPRLGGDPDVLWVGRFVAGKDPLTVLDGFERFAKVRPGARLWLVGPEDGPLTVEVRRRLPAGATVVGRLPRAELAGWYAACPLLVSASRHEGSGYALIEAMAAGCVPVLSELPSHRTIGGDVARYFPAGDADSLAGALAAAAPAADAEGRAAVRARFAAALGWERVVDQLLAAYRGDRHDEPGPRPPQTTA